ncbi:hypothetical protein Sste5346_007766 [Sporothrix stenoceras]|uniref:Uncharacterized protein n=1 Tax=Sporothrix stenoceras TaxID=5173 RepID=A0ABR3YSH8_9PEZI
MHDHPTLHVQPDYQMVPLAEQMSQDTPSQYTPSNDTPLQYTPSQNKSDYEVYTSEMSDAKDRDTKTEPSSATASLLSPAPPFYAQPAFDPNHGGPGQGIQGRQTGSWPEPKELGPEWHRRVISLIAEIVIATLSLLFAIYGILVYKHDGSLAVDPNSAGRHLYSVSQYAPTIFPVLFAAVVGSCLKGVVTYSLQTGRGATIGMLEQLLGSQSMYRAISTQIRMHAYNPLGILLLMLWALSPLGGQASLRVISIGSVLNQTDSSIIAVNLFQKFTYGNGANYNVALTSVANPVIAAMMGASFLSSRNQDLWGNLRFPTIERIEAAYTAAGNSSVNGWFDVPETTNLTYSSLVGAPVTLISSEGNTSFTLSGSYLSLSCPVFGKTSQTAFTNYTAVGNNTPPAVGNGYDCTWASAQGGTQYQLAFSMPCNVSTYPTIDPNTPRPARKLIWESFSQFQDYTHAECDVYTSHVDTNFTCTGSETGSSGSSSCTATHVRRSVDPAMPHSNWTVFDFGFIGDPSSVIKLLTTMFPNAQLSGNVQPVVAYMAHPYGAVGIGNESPDDTPTYQVGVDVFQTRLAQLLNPILYIGSLDANTMTGPLNTTAAQENLATMPINVTSAYQQREGVNAIDQQVVLCSRPWLGVLITSSFVMFIMALVGAVLRLLTIVPDVLESVTLSLLHHQTEGVVGSSTWTASEWARHNRFTRLFFGDVQPNDDIGRLALSTVGNARPVGPIQVGRVYM